MMIRIVILSAVILFSSTALAQEDPRLDPLAARIMERIPDIPSTRHVLGRRGQRPARAILQAQAILDAADANAPRWDAFAQRGGWTLWDSYTDLPALIAAMAMRESYMQPIIRLDGGERVRELPVSNTPVNVEDMHRRMNANRQNRRVVRADMGVMQVRAPSGPARACGVRTESEHRRLATNLAFGYLVGTCVMTNRVDRFVEAYQTREYQRLRPNQRPNTQLRFYGVWGDRQNTDEARRARELLVLERYNWGGGDLYMHRIASGYAQRVIREFEFFRVPLNDPNNATGK